MNKNIVLVQALAVFFLLILSVKHGGAQVALDSAFRGKGFSLFSSSNYPGSKASAHTMLRDGRIFTCGTGLSTGCVYRFLDNGSIDKSFSSARNGYLDIYICGIPLQMAKLAGDTILLYGQAGSDYSLVKLDSAGNFCSDFGKGGNVTRSIPELAYFGCTPTALAIQPDGKILITASASTSFPPTLVMRLLPNGDYDTTFGTGGYVYLPFGSCGFKANAIFMQSSGKIIVTGDYYSIHSSPFYGSCRLRADGVVDSTYGTNGVVHTDVSINSRVSASYQQADEKVILAGIDGYMLRYTSNGILDTSFEATVSWWRTLYQYKFGNNCVPSDIVDDTAGRHYVYGQYRLEHGNWSSFLYYIMRLKPDGQIDSSFNGTGYFEYSIETARISTQSVTSRSMIMLSDYKLLLYGDVTFSGIGPQIFLSQLYIHPHLESANIGNVTSFCLGDTAQLKVHTAGAVQWMRNDTLLADTGTVLRAWRSGSYTAITTYLNGKAHDTSNSLAIVFHVPALPVVTAKGNSLHTCSGGSAYQWYDSSGKAIVGATDSIFSPSAAGTYLVTVIDSNGCFAKSNQYSFLATGILNKLLSGTVRIYPNPTTGVFSIQAAAGALSICNIQGQELVSYQLGNGKNNITLPKSFSAGIYIARYSSTDGKTSQVTRLIYQP